MKSINEMRMEFHKIVNGFDVHPSCKIIHEFPQHDGSPHVEKIGNDWYFVVTERGSEFERIKSNDPEYILYLLVCEVAHGMATAYELKNRIPGIDGRRIRFNYDVSLLSGINKTWGQRKMAEYDKILELHPFSDVKSAQQGDAPEPASPAR